MPELKETNRELPNGHQQASVLTSDVEKVAHAASEDFNDTTNPAKPLDGTEDPRNWSSGMKFFHVMVPCLLSFQM